MFVLSDSDEGEKSATPKPSRPSLSPVPTKYAKSGSGISSPPSIVQAGNTATTTTAHQSAMEGDILGFFCFPSTIQAGDAGTPSRSLTKGDSSVGPTVRAGDAGTSTTVRRSLTEGDSSAGPSTVQADDAGTSTTARRFLAEGDSSTVRAGDAGGSTTAR